MQRGVRRPCGEEQPAASRTMSQRPQGAEGSTSKGRTCSSGTCNLCHTCSPKPCTRHRSKRERACSHKGSGGAVQGIECSSEPSLGAASYVRQPVLPIANILFATVVPAHGTHRNVNHLQERHWLAGSRRKGFFVSVQAGGETLTKRRSLRRASCRLSTSPCTRCHWSG